MEVERKKFRMKRGINRKIFVNKKILQCQRKERDKKGFREIKRGIISSSYYTLNTHRKNKEGKSDGKKQRKNQRKSDRKKREAELKGN